MLPFRFPTKTKISNKNKGEQYEQYDLETGIPAGSCQHD